MPKVTGLVSALVRNKKGEYYGKLQYCIVWFCKNCQYGIYFVSIISLVFGCGNVIDGPSMDSYSACYGNQVGGKDFKNSLSVAQM